MTSLDKALRVLDALGRQGRSGVKSLSLETGFPPPTVHRLLASLARGGYVRQEPASKEYMLALKFLELGSRVRNDLNLVSLARPAMRDVMELSGETVNLVVFDNFEAVYVDQVANPQSMLRMFTQVGARVPLYCSGAGKAYLAAQPEQDVLDYFRLADKKRHTSQTILDEAVLLAELAKVRQRGYAMDNEEMEYGVRCVAVLIRQYRGHPAGALSISGPSSRLTLERIPALGPQLRRVAEDIGQQLGFAKT